MQKLFDEEMHSALQQLMDETIEALQLAKVSPDLDDLGATFAVALLKLGLATSFVDGWFRAVAYARNNKEHVIRVGAKTLGIGEPAARAAYDAEITKMLRDSGRFDARAVDVIRRSLVEIGTLEQMPPAQGLFDERFLRDR